MSIGQRLKQLATESAVYGLAPIIQRLISVFLTPLYTRLFVPADYGAMSLIDSTISLLAPFAVLSLDSAAFRWFYDAKTEEDQHRAVGTWFWTQICLATVLSAIVALVPSRVVASLTDHPGARQLLVVALISMPLATFEQVIGSQARMQRKPWRALGIMLAGSLLTIGLTLTLVYWMRVGLIGIYLATLATRLIIATTTIVLIRGWLSPRLFQLPLLRSMLHYSLPMVPTSLFFWVIALSDRFFVAHYWNATEVGLYSIGVSIGAVLTLVTGAFQNAWAAFAFSIKDQDDAPRTYALAMEGYLFVSCLAGLGLALFATEALHILTPPRYYPAENVVAPLVVGYVMAGLCQITQIGAMLVKRTRAVFEAFGLAALANLLLNVALIPRYGRLGAAYATLLSQAVLPLHLLWRSQRLYHIPYRSWLTVAIPTLTLVLALVVRSVVTGLPLVAAIGVKLLAVLAFAATLIFTSPLRDRLFARVGVMLARET